ncbi:acyltransferase family protein [Paenibacillus sp. GCM10027627]|uniref:acyltransferase family protein n=1 Tax=unclassified Paenibacillus TaxID=185978 RepID=UPI00364164B9
MPKPLDNNYRYMPGLDGLRAIAVLTVIAYHLNVKGIPGGLLGVTMFFVLSGYLITDLLLKQLSQNKTLDLKTFFIRRTRRLLPAMFLMIAVVSLGLLILDPNRLLSLKGDIGSALLYINNWWLIFHEVSYFESFGPASPFGHLWSLAVEEQFYLLWPFILLIAIRFSPKRGKLALWTLAAAAISAGAMALLYVPGSDPSRVYYGTDTRAFGLLIGAALAIVWPSSKLSSTLSERSRRLLDGIGMFGFGVIIVMMAQIGEYDSFLYQGGMVLFALATAAVVAVLAHPASKLAGIVGNKAFTWIGVRSYGIYLYHYPIIVLTTPTAEAAEFHLARAFMQLALTLVLAELSWRFIEEPIRRGALGNMYTWVKQKTKSSFRLRKTTALAAVIVLVLTGVSCTGSANLQSESLDAKKDDSAVAAPNQTKEATTGNTQGKAKQDKQKDTVNTVKPNGSDKKDTKDITEEKPVTEQKPDQKSDQKTDQKSSQKSEQKESNKQIGPSSNPGSAVKPVPEKKPVTPLNKHNITAIGDSVLLDAAPYLEKQLPGIYMDGKVGRQFGAAANIIEQLKKSNKLADTVVIQLGTNGSFTTKQMNELLGVIGEKREIVFINTRVPRKWQDSVNKMLAATAKKASNVTIIDWYAASKGNEDLFAADGVHLKKKGAELYASLIVDSLTD